MELSVVCVRALVIRQLSDEFFASDRRDLLKDPLDVLGVVFEGEGVEEFFDGEGNLFVFLLEADALGGVFYVAPKFAHLGVVLRREVHELERGKQEHRPKDKEGAEAPKACRNFVFAS